MTARPSVQVAQAYARICARTDRAAQPPATTQDAPTARMRAYLLRAVAETYDDCAARGELPDALGGCLSARDFIAAAMSMTGDRIPVTALHDIDSCPCLVCSFYGAYDWDLFDAPLAVASARSLIPAP